MGGTHLSSLVDSYISMFRGARMVAILTVNFGWSFWDLCDGKMMPRS